MIEVSNAYSIIMNILNETMQEAGFENKKPAGLKKDALPVFTETGKSYAEYMNNNATVRMEMNEKSNTFTLYIADTVNPSEKDYRSVSTWGFNPQQCEERDVESIGKDFMETLQAKYAPHMQHTSVSTGNIKMPQTVSRAKVKSGVVAFDTKTLATRFAAMFPQFKDDVRTNVAEYGDFYPETFFSKIAAPHVIKVIQSGDTHTIKKMLSMFHELFEDGSFDVQGTIAVTLLGQMKNDSAMMNTVDKYLQEPMRTPVIEVNKLLGSKSGVKYLKKLDNPPVYKPKKEKNYMKPEGPFI